MLVKEVMYEYSAFGLTLLSCRTERRRADNGVCSLKKNTPSKDLLLAPTETSQLRWKAFPCAFAFNVSECVFAYNSLPGMIAALSPTIVGCEPDLEHAKTCFF